MSEPYWIPTGAAIAPAAPVTYRKVTTRTVASSVTATDLLNGEITIPGGILTATGMLELTAFGDWLCNGGATSAPPRFQLVLGGTTLIDTNTPGATVPVSATRGSWRIRAMISALNATNSQHVNLEMILQSGASTYAVVSTMTVAFTTGTGHYKAVAARGNTSNTDGGLYTAFGHATGSKDMTASNALVLNVINGQNNANYDTRLHGAIARIL